MHANQYDIAWHGATWRDLSSTLAPPPVLHVFPRHTREPRLRPSYGLAEQRDAVLAVIGDEWCTIATVAARTQVHKDTAALWLRRLQADGVVERSAETRAPSQTGRMRYLYRRKDSQ